MHDLEFPKYIIYPKECYCERYEMPFEVQTKLTYIHTYEHL